MSSSTTYMQSGVAADHEADLKRRRNVRQLVIEEIAIKVVEAVEANSRLTVKGVLELIHGMKTREVFESRIHGAKWVSRSQ